VTHDQSEAFSLGHRIAIMREGTLQQIAEPDVLRQSPANRFVADFLGQGS
jgi:ABC-type sugar transport system ATPase subunit